MNTKREDPPGLKLKKQTFEAWARLLFKEGLIDEGHCSRMIEAIAKLRN